MSWRLWLIGLTCSLAWISALLTYMIQWEIGWFFALVMVGAMTFAWIGEEDLRQMHWIQINLLRQDLEEKTSQLTEARQIQEEQSAVIERRRVDLMSLTDDFLDVSNFACKYCESKSIWFFTSYKFHPAAHHPGCRVVLIRQAITPSSLWLPTGFDPKYLDPNWAQAPEVLNNPAFADFFTESPESQDG